MGQLVSAPPWPSNKTITNVKTESPEPRNETFLSVFKVTRHVIKCCPIPIYTISSLAAVLTHAHSGSDVSTVSEDSGLKGVRRLGQVEPGECLVGVTCVVLPFADKQQDQGGIYATVNV